MKKMFTLILILNIAILSAQNPKEYAESVIHIESEKGENKKTCEGFFFHFLLTKEKVLYTVIVASKATVSTSSSEIKLFLNREKEGKPNNDEPYVLSLPSDSKYIIQDPDNELVIIPFGEIYRMLAKENIQIHYIPLTEDSLQEMKVPINETDLLKIKERFEWEINTMKISKL